jgi:hypothetical protein
MINCADIDIPENYKDFFKLMVKHKAEGNTLLINIAEHWHTVEIQRINHNSRDIAFKVLGYGNLYVYEHGYEKEYRNLFMNSTYVIEDMFYRIANAGS